LGKTEEALTAMKAASESSPDDRDILAELKKLMAKKKAESVQDRNLYRKMFQGVQTVSSSGDGVSKKAGLKNDSGSWLVSVFQILK
jgi:hypothetical protein